MSVIGMVISSMRGQKFDNVHMTEVNFLVKVRIKLVRLNSGLSIRKYLHVLVHKPTNAWPLKTLVGSS